MSHNINDEATKIKIQRRLVYLKKADLVIDDLLVKLKARHHLAQTLMEIDDGRTDTSSL